MGVILHGRDKSSQVQGVGVIWHGWGKPSHYYTWLFRAKNNIHPKRNIY